ncbi:MAG TPA: class I SAM-dependent methyltransferase [Flavobacteriales bacterium]|nr:class I SAM-dependent methyltransferase [Flavobacteriales bacterium]
MLLLTPAHWNDYELLDSGNFEKLERFGKYITIRPEPQAIWKPVLEAKEWMKQAHVKFIQKSSAAGEWKKLKDMPDQWKIQYPMGDKSITLRLGLTNFKHVGVFPEQAVNWNYIYDNLTAFKTKNPRFLNLFAYTGAASLAAKAAGADVVHVDSIKQVVTWANENMKHSNLDNIRWVVEDAVKFVQREIKRGSKYHGIILDPPSYGHGPNGEKWKLEENIMEMMDMVLNLLDPEEHFLILNAYSLGFSALVIENMLKGNNRKLETGELFLHSKTGQKLPLGVFGRFLHT